MDAKIVYYNGFAMKWRLRSSQVIFTFLGMTSRLLITNEFINPNGANNAHVCLPKIFIRVMFIVSTTTMTKFHPTRLIYVLFAVFLVLGMSRLCQLNVYQVSVLKSTRNGDHFFDSIVSRIINESWFQDVEFIWRDKSVSSE